MSFGLVKSNCICTSVGGAIIDGFYDNITGRELLQN